TFVTPRRGPPRRHVDYYAEASARVEGKDRAARRGGGQDTACVDGRGAPGAGRAGRPAASVRRRGPAQRSRGRRGRTGLRDGGGRRLSEGSTAGRARQASRAASIWSRPRAETDRPVEGLNAWRWS